jgi:hypothetical protein
LLGKIKNADENPLFNNSFSKSSTLFNLADSPSEICPGYELKYGDPYTAKWLLMGENHDRHEETKKCVDIGTAKLGFHRILVESIQSEEEILCEEHEISLREDRKCIGWDNITLDWNQLSQALTYQMLLIFIFKRFELKGTDKFMNDEFDLIYNIFKNNYTESLKKFQQIGYVTHI